MTDGNDQQRRHRRFQVDVQATVRTADARQLLARTRDLSRSGICLVTSEALTSATPLSVELVLLLAPGSSSEPLTLKARVVWCTAIAGAFQVGAMFDSVSGREAAFLDMFLRYLDGTILPAGAEMDAVEDPDTVTASDDLIITDINDDPFTK